MLPIEMWQIFIDTGGTFTDCLGVAPDGAMHRTKVLSHGALRADIASVTDGQTLQLAVDWTLPDDFFTGFTVSRAGSNDSVAVNAYDANTKMIKLEFPLAAHVVAGDLVELHSGEEPPILGARVLTKTPRLKKLPPLSMRLGTTRGTNALLERKGVDVAFFVTKGFKDLLFIGNQQRPDLFTLKIEKPEPLYQSVIEVDERIDAEGNVLTSIHDREPAFVENARAVLKSGTTVAAVALMNSIHNPSHEEQLCRTLFDLGFKEVILSSALSPYMKIVPRAQTAVVNAYLAPIMNQYLDRVQSAIEGNRLHVMTSAGGLVPRIDYRPKDGLLSGPAGGVVGASSMGLQAMHQKVIAFDMGGTSTDVSRFEGSFEYQSKHQVGDAEVLAPSLKIETVAAGGGSICGYDGHALFVGPASAGATPGPACYGTGGPLTITDVNLLLGRLNTAAFSIPVTLAAAEEKLNALANSLEMTADKLLQGFLDIANERMADAIKKISVREGYDPQEYALVAFGGAGGLHACAVAQTLGAKTVLYPEDAGLLSAYGLKQAAIERFAEKQLLQPLDTSVDALPGYFEALFTEASNQLMKDGVAQSEISLKKQVAYLRLAGQEATLAVSWSQGDDLYAFYQKRYEQVFGYFPENCSIEVYSLQVVVSTSEEEQQVESFEEHCLFNKHANTIKALFEGLWQDVPLITRKELQAGDYVDGPAIISDDFSGFVVEPNWRAVMGDKRTIKLVANATQVSPQDSLSEVVELELFKNRFLNIVDEMGLQLERTALSTNVKERLDFSCALLDSQGRLIANAPHIPVHLGALGLCVRMATERLSIEPGDVIITNHPGVGGSHLPDVTVITPVFNEAATLVGYVANRAHHAEMGGIRPGSMPPNASCLAEEGVVIAPMFLFKKGKACYNDLEALLSSDSFPSRAVQDNLADVRAQVAANRRGESALLNLVAQFGESKVVDYMDHLRLYTAGVIAHALSDYSMDEREARQQLDDGTTIAVRISKAEDGKIVFDFEGTSGAHPGNLNATPAIVRSAVIYFLRLLIEEDLPLNEGLMDNVDIKLPRCFLNPDFSLDAQDCPAVVGGNVETSQRIVDTLIQAFGIAACSQGTMNNLVFGNDACSYYETICGGEGATEGHHGRAAVHTHMTNTAITDPEILEFRYPIRLKQFSVRVGSGGSGQYRGGDGVIRELEFLAPLSVSLLTQHREQLPFGMGGGAPGKAGQQTLTKKTGECVTLQSIDHFDVEAGDSLQIETPGGGGFGSQ